MQSAAERQLDFLRKLQRLLDEGDFSSTYKFALLQALADLSVEGVPSPTGTLAVSLEQIAAKFVEYYWRQALPYREHTVLAQNAGKEAAVLHRIGDERARHDGNLAALRSDRGAWQRALRVVKNVVRHMPVRHLQNVGGGTDEFLFRRAEIRDGRLTLLPGVAEALRTFHPFVTQLVRAGWVERVRRIGRNRPLLGTDADLHEFLFGSDRRILQRFRAVVRDHQSSRCFYCGREDRRGDADHFIPWSRYPVDLGHNFVYACKPCNHAKRDYLAFVDHLARWREENLLDVALTQAFEHDRLAHDLERTRCVVSWAYEQAEQARAQRWIADGRFTPIDDRWRKVLFPLPAAAEEAATYRPEA